MNVDMAKGLPPLFDWSQTTGLLPCPFFFRNHAGPHFPEESDDFHPDR
jgi:hypothetical protein